MLVIIPLIPLVCLLPAAVEANKQVSNNISRYHVQCNIRYVTAINRIASFIQNYCNVIISSSASGGTNCPTLPSRNDPQVDTQ